MKIKEIIFVKVGRKVGKFKNYYLNPIFSLKFVVYFTGSGLIVPQIRTSNVKYF